MQLTTALRVIGLALLKSAGMYLAWIFVWRLALAVNVKTVSEVPWFVLPAGLALVAIFYLVRVKPEASQKGRLGVIVAYALCAVCVVICTFVLQGWFTSMPATSNLQAAPGTPLRIAAMYVLAAPVLAGMLEELVFRGGLQPALIQLWGARIGIAVVTLVFVIWHLPNPLFLYQWMGYLALGGITGVLAHYGKSLGVSVAVHGCINLIMNIYVCATGSTEVHADVRSIAFVVTALLLSALGVYLFGRSLAQHLKSEASTVAAKPT